MSNLLISCFTIRPALFYYVSPRFAGATQIETGKKQDETVHAIYRAW
jgi:hypothetical protein